MYRAIVVPVATKDSPCNLRYYKASLSALYFLQLTIPITAVFTSIIKYYGCLSQLWHNGSLPAEQNLRVFVGTHPYSLWVSGFLAHITAPRCVWPGYTSLVAVHGLNGDALGTWTHTRSQTMWLRDILPTVLPTVRVMTYGYNASIKNFTAQQDIRSISAKMLIALVDLRKTEEVCTGLG